MRVLFIATRDPRRRYRFLHDPLLDTDVEVDLFEDAGMLLSMIPVGLKAMRRSPPADVVMLTGGDIRNFIWFLLTKIFTRARIVVRFGGDPIEVRESAQKTFIEKGHWGKYFRSLVGKWLTRVLLKYCDGVIVVSEFLLNSLQAEIGKRVQTLVLAPTIPDMGLEEGELPSRDDRDRIRLLTVTNLNYREKADGVKMIAESIHRIARRGECQQGIDYDILGGGHQLESLRDELGRTTAAPDTTVELHGKSSEVAEFYRRADIFVYCSSLDGYPLVLCEAQSFGLPIVANRWGGFPDMLNEEKDALFFDSDSIAELDVALCSLIGNAGLRQQMGAAARENFLRKNAPETCARRLQEFLQGLI